MVPYYLLVPVDKWKSHKVFDLAFVGSNPTRDTNLYKERNMSYINKHINVIRELVRIDLVWTGFKFTEVYQFDNGARWSQDILLEHWRPYDFAN